VLIQLDQARQHVVSTDVMLQHAEQVLTLAGAQAHDAYVAGWAIVESFLDTGLDGAQTERKPRVRVGVQSVPFTPTDLRHDSCELFRTTLPESDVPVPANHQPDSIASVRRRSPRCAAAVFEAWAAYSLAMPVLPDAWYTPRLRARKPRLGDAQPIFESYATDDLVTRYLSWRPNRGVEDTRQFIASYRGLGHRRSIRLDADSLRRRHGHRDDRSCVSRGTGPTSVTCWPAQYGDRGS
jgi:hypothetical protein